MSTLHEKNKMEIRLTNNMQLLPIATQSIVQFARIAGFSENACRQIEMAAEEAVANVIKHAYLPEETADFSISLQAIPAGISISIHDKGLPFDPDTVRYDAQSLQGLGSYVMGKLMDKMTYINHGKAGKELNLVKYFEEIQPEAASEDSSIPDTPGASLVHTYTFRAFRPDDAIEVARCAYESYGYTYAYEHIYFPERVKALNASGDLISLIAEADNGDVAGHIALVRIEGYDGLYELGLAMTKQRYRGGSIFGQLLNLAYTESENRELHAVFGQCVTTHTYSQSAPLKTGMFPTALLPAYVPDDVAFRKIADDIQRRTAVLIVNKILRPSGQNTVYPPEKYIALAQSIYEGLGIERDIKGGIQPAPESTALSKLSINSNLKMAKILLNGYDAGYSHNLKNIIHQLKREQISMAEAFVNLSDPACPQMILDAEAVGFRFTGILPGAVQGDIAILQYLNGIEPNVDQIKVLEKGKFLLDFIAQQFD